MREYLLERDHDPLIARNTEREGPELSSTRVQRLEPSSADHVFPDSRRLCVPGIILTLPFLALRFTYLTSV